MTPAARVQAAIELLDRIAAGQAAEQALTSWGRAARYAGSKDRAAVRDLVFDALRCWRSTAALGGGETGRARLLGLLRLREEDPDTIFTGLGHAPAPLGADEQAAGQAPEGAAALDLPDWLAARFRDSLGSAAEATALALRSRAEVFLRVNLLRATPDTALARLAEDGILAEPHDLSATALRVTGGARGIMRSSTYLDGLVELQDAASQAVVDLLPLKPGMRVLDYCAGGGGKALAMAAPMRGGPVVAHDAAPKRMVDLPARAARAGADVRITATPEGDFDLVLCDVPCSGSGAWRRAPEGKWRLTEARLADLCTIQSEILDQAAGFVVEGGVLAYATCSVLAEENAAQVSAFLDRRPGWAVEVQRQFLPESGGDGFFAAVLRRTDT
ncbi:MULTISPECIES: RsmB/NOP family class I SAM-dependent RNA methyltransferase [Mameliella]|uniref:RsmB/NOP family class I SAM-dependent RNA methyltransferase n=1 Tax=Mameliella TaxID=1434019 RepID=UPI000B52DFA5|nr:MULTISPECIES: RsmB/NOP family class I SAM-dependent RNA methyltransferase [Mameliella]MCR9271915.1 RsmB/NOP family class I SAM-dependent RNA methyltransferase [Paracoccaceae bacterium]OWV62869.1 SAM-dependent methyltransferase [Mameliella alba]